MPTATATAQAASAASASASAHLNISDRDFALFQALMHDVAGIHLSTAKKQLVCGRLSKRLRERGLSDYGAYYALLQASGEDAELQTCVDLLTTNETYFFREPKHFEFLCRQILPGFRGAPFRAWSAACSSGEEPYSIAMAAQEVLGDGAWQVLGSDISTQVLGHARRATYTLERARNLTPEQLRKYCLKGVRSQAGTLRVHPMLGERVEFGRINLNRPLPAVGRFDVIFLRNVMIYFDMEVKRAVIARLLHQLNPGGWLFVGHSESLNGICDTVRTVAPAVYRKL
jgi:chemotaxis protein methyltransferase CheR